MNAAALDDLRPRRPGGMGRGAMLALVAHVGLLIAIAFGVNWRSSEPTGATAELWAAVPEVAAPAAVAPPAPPVPPKPEPKPVPKVEPPPPKPEVREAEIALEKAKVEKAKREREREALEAKARAEAEEKKRKEQETAKAKAAEKAEKAEADRIAKAREDQLKRIQGQAGATGVPQSTGTGTKDAAPTTSSGYGDQIRNRVKPNIVLTEAVPAGVRAVVEVRASPDGTIVGRRLVKPSGNKDWDDAVLRAIDRTEVLPRDVDGRVPPSIEIGFTPS